MAEETMPFLTGKTTPTLTIYQEEVKGQRQAHCEFHTMFLHDSSHVSIIHESGTNF
jgi:hypothetical protein